MISRRKLLKVLSASGVALSIPASKIASLTSIARASSNVDGQGELYGGFLLLPNNTPPPSSVKFPAAGIPQICGVGGQGATAISRQFGNHNDLRKAVPFPIPTFARLPQGVTPIGGEIIEYPWGDTFAATINFGTASSDPSMSTVVATIVAQLTFPQPYPVWYTPGPDLSLPFYPPEKTTVLSASALRFISPRIAQTSYLWIQKGVLYQLALKQVPVDQADPLAQSLSLV